MATYVMSDIHGQYELFQEILKKMDFSENDFLYVLGDVIDRGPDGIKLLQTIRKAPNMDLLIGNHEWMMLNSVAPDGSVEDIPGEDADLWLGTNGGEATWDGYRVLAHEERKALLAWLRSRKISTLVSISGRIHCLTHTYFRDGLIDVEVKDCDPQAVDEAVWMTPYRDDLRVPVSRYEKKNWEFVIGHVPVQNVRWKNMHVHNVRGKNAFRRNERGKNVLKNAEKLEAFRDKKITLIDGGCAVGKECLTWGGDFGIICLRLEDREEFTVTFEELYGEEYLTTLWRGLFNHVMCEGCK